MGLHEALSQLVIRCPWIPVLFLVPICIVYDTYCFVRLRINFLFRSRDPRKHSERVEHVQEQVRQWIKDGQRSQMCTARPGYKSITLQTLSYKDRCHQVDVNLPDIISIDTEKRLVRVEPMVTIGQLNDYLIGRGWTLPVVPELDDLTIGGLVMGGGIETTSHKYGLFHCICKSYEMVLANGKVVTCTEDVMPDLYTAIPFSYGTLGFLTAVEIDIIPYKKYIKLTYFPVRTVDQAVAVFERETKDPSKDSVEGIMFSMNEGVIMSGTFVDKREDYIPTNPIGRWYKPWFYKHVVQFLGDRFANQDHVEYIPALDFYHRHARPCFWLIEYIIPFGNSPVFRWLFGWTLPPKHAMIKKLKEKFVPPRLLSTFVCQDFGVEFKDLKALFEICEKEASVYPIWLCPCKHKMSEKNEQYSMFKLADLYIDFGIYGFTSKPDFDAEATQKKFERFILDKEGFVALYAETQLSREDFNEMLELKTYERLRKELGCEKAFPHMYEKVSKIGRTAI